MRQPDQHWLQAAIFTVALLVLIAFATGGVGNTFFFVILFVVLAAVTLFYVLFPGSLFFTISLADFLAVYVCVFVILAETNFESVSAVPLQLGFALPILSFLAGVWWRREAIRNIVTSHHLRERRNFSHVFVWLIPIFAIGALTFLLPGRGLGPATIDAVFLGAMATISVIVLVVSRSVCTFLLDTGLLFEEFFREISRLVVPAFAFFTFYSLIVIVFACVYRIIDRYSAVFHFQYNGEWQKLTFSDSLYFSIITLSTVGYGDIEPVSNLVRILVSVEIIFGVLLLLFGFSEILRYTRERRSHDNGRES